MFENVVETFFEMVQIDSPSGAEASFRQWLINAFEKLQGQPETDATGNLKINIPGILDKPPLLFAAHMDTVEPGCGIRPQRLPDGRIVSAGDTVLGADDKDGITAILCAIQEIKLQNLPHPPLELLFTVSEENNLGGSRNLPADWLQARQGWVFDGPGELGSIYRNGVGKQGFLLQVEGQAAHAAICPEDGRNAFAAMAEGILSFLPGRRENATLNYGTIQGGHADNIVPDRVELTLEIRSHDSVRLAQLATQMQTCWQAAVKKHGCHLQCTHGSSYPAFALPATSPHYQYTVSILQKLGLSPQLKNFNAGCDANYLCAAGLDLCVIATGRKANHSVAETTTYANLKCLSKIAFHLMTGAELLSHASSKQPAS
ncbi:MAG: M20/M25/M40 family metallo-hydrolase [Lentisphaeria bacterium]